MSGPLTGLKMLDFSTLLPGPYASMLLADLGVEVLRISSGTRVDFAEHMAPFVSEKRISANLAWLGRGKRTMTLNLKSDRGLGIALELVKEYDIILEQFRPGVMKELGLGYADLKKINPALIYCSLTGYGQSGPMSPKAGHDINYLSRAGVMAHSGLRKAGPVLTGMQIADVAAGSSNAVIGILAAVLHRSAGGRGQHIDISMTDGALAFNTFAGAALLADGNLEPQREGELLNGGSLYDFYATKDDRYISFGGLEPQFFEAFCKVVGCPELIEQGVVPKDLAKIKEQVGQRIKTRTRDEWVAEFSGVDACVEPVLSLAEALNDSHIRSRGMVVDLELPEGGSVEQIANPIIFSETRPQYHKIGEVTGTHTREVVMGLGYSAEDFEEFKKIGVFD